VAMPTVPHFQEELQQLKTRLLEMGGLAEDRLRLAVSGLVDRDPAVVERVLGGDTAINQLHIEIDDRVLKLLALHQPVAADLRFIITVLKVNNDLERIGDHAVSIAERAVVLSGLEAVPRPEDFDTLVSTVQRMMKDSLTALIERDADLARAVCEMDDEVDRVHRLMYSAMQTVMRNDIALIESAVNTISATRHLERIGDLATNIAEDVVFMVEGEILRHNY